LFLGGWCCVLLLITGSQNQAELTTAIKNIELLAMYSAPKLGQSKDLIFFKD
jgi:hypothetical protein